MNWKRQLWRSLVQLGLGFFAASACSGQSIWTEGWQAAQIRTYVVIDTTEDGIVGDRGGWIVYDSAPDCNGAPHPNTAEILSVGGNKILKMNVVPNDCVSDLSVDLFSSPNIPIRTNSVISFTQTGTLANPQWNGFFPTLFPPPGDSIHLSLLDQNKNAIVYVFQRTPQYPAHTTTLQVQFPDGHIGNVGYHEVFVDSHDATGGTYVRNLFQDFNQAPGFDPSGAQVSYIGFSISGVGTATFDDLKVGSGITATPPSIVSHPQSQSVRYGESVTFQVEAAGTAPFTYQWRKDRSDIPGATRKTVIIPSATLADNGNYSAAVANQAGAAVSQEATLTVDGRPYIITQPIGKTVESGEIISLNVSAAGAPVLTYQWKKDGFFLAGQSGPTLTMPNATTNESGTYSVMVSNRFGFDQSLEAVLTVRPPLTVGDAADAPLLVWTNGGNVPWTAQRATTFDGVDALEAGPLLLNTFTPQTAWLETVVSGPGILSFWWRASASPLETFYSLFVDDVLQTRITGVTTWQEVRLAIATGQHRVRWSFDTGSYLYSTDKAWLDQVRVLPRATNALFANTNTIRFPASGFAGVGAPYPSAINVSGMVGDVTEVVVHLNKLNMDTDGGGLDLLLVAPSGETSIVMSDAARLFAVSQATLQIDDLGLPVIPRDSSFTNGVFLPTDYPPPNSAFPADSFPSAPAGPWPHSLAAFRGANPNGQWRLFATYVSGFGGSGQLAGGWSLELLTRRDVISLESARLWGSEAQFVLTGPPGAGFVVQVTSNMVDWAPILTNSIPAQGWYPFFDDKNNGLLSRFYRTAPFSPIPPVITAQPQSQNVNRGDNLSFGVLATSLWPLNYQWKKNNSAIGGATNATLTLTNVQSGDAGNYIVVVDNGFYSANSSNAVLTVAVPVNDLFANRIVITGMTNSWAGSNAGATIEPGEPNHAGPNPFGIIGGKSVWWTWTAPMDGLVTLDIASMPGPRPKTSAFGSRDGLPRNFSRFWPPKSHRA